MESTVVPTVNGAATNASSGAPVPVASNGPLSIGGAPAASTQAAIVASSTPAQSLAAMPAESGAQQSSSGLGASVVNVNGSAAGGPPVSGIAGEIDLATLPVAEGQSPDFFGTGQSDFWGPASNAAWSTALSVPDSSAGYSIPSTDAFTSDSSMGDTLWYVAGLGSTDDSQIADDQSTTGADFGDQSPSAGGGFVSGAGGSSAQWPRG